MVFLGLTWRFAKSTAPIIFVACEVSENKYLWNDFLNFVRPICNYALFIWDNNCIFTFSCIFDFFRSFYISESRYSRTHSMSNLKNLAYFNKYIDDNAGRTSLLFFPYWFSL